MATSGKRHRIGINVTGILLIVLVLLKLFGVIDWSWWVVTLPLTITIVLRLILEVMLVVVRIIIRRNLR